MLAIANEFTALFMLVHLIVVTLLSWQVYRRASGAARYLGFIILYPWLLVTLLIALSGFVEDMTPMISPLGFVMTTVLILGLGLMFFWKPAQRAIDSLPNEWLIGIQAYRVLGFIFLIGWLNGELPLALGPITAFNDVVVGVTALIVALLVRSGRHTRLARAWNLFGLLDFAYAITVGVLAAPHALRLLPLTPDTAALGLLPLSLITLWAVPLSVMLHVASLRRLARQARTPVLAAA